MSTDEADVVVVGGGIVGLATARALQQREPGCRVVVLDKESRLAAHQSGRNSGVLHAGVYYRPGSFKARLCVAGRARMVEYCQERGIRHELCGKLVVAVTASELPALQELARRCAENGVAAEWLQPGEMREVEPHVRGVAALRVRASGIVDFADVCRALREDVVSQGGEFREATEVVGGRVGPTGVEVETSAGTLRSGRLVTCAGLHADAVAAAFGSAVDVRVLPFRGEYYNLAPERSWLVRALVYPVPDPRLPFLGVHATRGIHGDVHLGPNAVPALAREGYSWGEVDRRYLGSALRYPGSWRLARQYWRSGAGEIARSVSTAAFTRALQRLLPEVRRADLRPAPAGVRAQAVDRQGRLLDDFVLHQDGPRALHVLNAPSPAATASLAIGDVIAERLSAAGTG